MSRAARPGPQPSSPQPSPPPLAWALLVIAAALVGALAAAALVHTSLIIAVPVAVVLGAIAVAVFRSPARPGPARPGPARPGPARPGPARYGPAPERPVPERQDPGRASFPDPRRQPSSDAPSGADTVVELLPLQAPPGESRPAGQSWWDAAAGPAPRPSSAAQQAPAPDLSSYLASTLIAQCPRCGAFRLDARRAPNGWDFHCESCEYIWAWQPGTPWPPVRVMPGRRKSRPPSP
jgi:hypothetical protein